MGILNKKAQLQIQETIIAVFIFIVLIMFGLVFFYKVQSSSIANEFKDFQMEKNSIDFITLGELAEFSCSKAGIKESCIDVPKLLIFSSFSKEYFEKFGYKNITIYQVYPKTNNVRCTAVNLDNCGSWEVYFKKPSKVTSKIVRDAPVSLYFPDKDEYTLGIMVVEAYNV